MSACGIAGLLGAIIAAVGFVLKAEYPDWGRRLARQLVHVASSQAEPGRREDRREEWLAELEVIWAETDKRSTGLIFAASLALHYGVWVLLREGYRCQVDNFIFVTASTYALGHESIGRTILAVGALSLAMAPATYLLSVRVIAPQAARSLLKREASTTKLRRPSRFHRLSRTTRGFISLSPMIVFTCVAALLAGRPLAVAIVMIPVLMGLPGGNYFISVMNGAAAAAVSGSETAQN